MTSRHCFCHPQQSSIKEVDPLIRSEPQHRISCVRWGPKLQIWAFVGICCSRPLPSTEKPGLSTHTTASVCGAEDWTHNLTRAGEELCHEATPPTTTTSTFFFNYVCVCVQTYTHEYRCLQRPKEDMETRRGPDPLALELWAEWQAVVSCPK